MTRHTSFPVAPRSNCQNALRWASYYRQTAACYQDIASTLSDSYPSAAQDAAREATRFAASAAQLAAGQHRNQLSGEWK